MRIETEAATLIKPVTGEASDSIADQPLTQALSLVEDSFDLNQLRQWDAKDSRIRVKNAIAKRVSAITEGNG
jgi:hypothetical protein